MPMRGNVTPIGRVVKSVHGRREPRPDPDFEIGLAESLKHDYGPAGLVDLYGRFLAGDGLHRRELRDGGPVAQLHAELL